MYRNAKTVILVNASVICVIGCFLGFEWWV